MPEHLNWAANVLAQWPHYARRRNGWSPAPSERYQRDSPLVAIHAGSGSFCPARRWPVHNFAVVADALATRYDARLLLVGGPDEHHLVAELAERIQAPVLNLAGRTNLKQLAALLAKCDLFLGNDSGVMHLAVAAGAPVVAVFGPTNHRAWGPYPPDSERLIVVRQGLECSPCLYVGHGLGDRRGCADCRCLRDLSPEAVLAAAERLLACFAPQREKVDTL